MSVEIQNVQRLRVISESNFATDQTASLASFVDVPFREGTATVELTTDSLDPMQSVQHLDQYRKEVLGKRSAKLTFTLNLAPTGTAAGTSTPAVQGALGLLLKASMGGEQLGTGSTVVSAASGSSITVTSAAGFAAGTACGWVNGSGQLEVREIESISTNTLTLKYAFSSTPTATNVIYSGATYYLTQDPQESLQFLMAGYESDDRFLLLGGQLTSLALAVDPTGAALPSVQLTYEFANYLESDETASSITGAIGNAAYTNYNPIVGHAGHLLFPTVGTATYSANDLVHASAIGFTPKVVFQRVTSPSGENTVLRWRRSRQAPVIEGTFTEPFQNLDRLTGRDARTDKAVWLQLGRSAGSTVMLSAPTVQIVNPQRAADGGGLAATTVAWKGRLDEDTGASVTDLAKSAFRIHLI